jgi:hypothetical protein
MHEIRKRISFHLPAFLFSRFDLIRSRSCRRWDEELARSCRTSHPMLGKHSMAPLLPADLRVSSVCRCQTFRLSRQASDPAIATADRATFPSSFPLPRWCSSSALGRGFILYSRPGCCDWVCFGCSFPFAGMWFNPSLLATDSPLALKADE